MHKTIPECCKQTAQIFTLASHCYCPIYSQRPPIAHLVASASLIVANAPRGALAPTVENTCLDRLFICNKMVSFSTRKLTSQKDIAGHTKQLRRPNVVRRLRVWQPCFTLLRFKTKMI